MGRVAFKSWAAGLELRGGVRASANHHGGSKKFIAKWKNVAREYQEQPDEDLPPLLDLRDARLLRDATERFESLVIAN